MRLALGLVRVQHLLGQAAVEHPGQLPGEVGRIPHAAAQSLPDERRGEVGGVAEQEHPPVAPAVGQAGPEGVFGQPHQPQPADRDVAGPRGDQRVQPGRVAEVVPALPGQQPELPAVPGRADPHVRAGPVRVAQLVYAVPLGQVGVGVHVDDQPALLQVQVLQAAADRGPDHAVGAVAAEHVLGQDRLAAAGDPVADLDPHPAGAVLDHVGDLAVAADGHRRIAGQVRAEDALQHRLVEHVRLGVPVPAGRGAPPELGQHPQVAAEQPQPLTWPGDRGELLGHPQPG